VLIWQGGVRTKKKKLVEDKLRQALGVDEDVPETVKRPRRATVAGASPLTERPSPLPPVPPVGTVSNRFGKDVKDVLVLESVDEEEDKEKEDIAVLVRRGST
jgi:hypothetical protein